MTNVFQYFGIFLFTTESALPFLNKTIKLAYYYLGIFLQNLIIHYLNKIAHKKITLFDQSDIISINSLESGVCLRISRGCELFNRNFLFLRNLLKIEIIKFCVYFLFFALFINFLFKLLSHDFQTSFKNEFISLFWSWSFFKRIFDQLLYLFFQMKTLQFNRNIDFELSLNNRLQNHYFFFFKKSELIRNVLSSKSEYQKVLQFPESL